jgi:hypothetical protein
LRRSAASPPLGTKEPQGFANVVAFQIAALFPVLSLLRFRSAPSSAAS